MQVKRFVAADMRRALELVRQELGPDAIILSSGRVPEGVELLTTTGSDSELMQLQQQPLGKMAFASASPMMSDGAWAEAGAIERAAKKHASTGSSTTANTHMGNASSGNRKTGSTNIGKSGQQLFDDIEHARLRILANQNAEASAKEFLVAKNTVVNAGIPRHASTGIKSAESTEFKALESKIVSQGQTRNLKASTKTSTQTSAEAASAVETFALLRKMAQPVESAAERYPLIDIDDADDDAENDTLSSDMSARNSELHELQAEIADMRFLLEQQLDRLSGANNLGGVNNSALSSPVLASVGRRLERLGLPAALVGDVLKSCTKTHMLSEAWSDALANLARKLPVNGRDIVNQGGVFAFVGPTGVGKTTTIGKLAARYVLQYGADKVALITTDTYRIAAHDQLRSLARILRVPVRVVDESNSLESLLRSLRHCSLILIDTAGFRHGDPHLKAQLKDLADQPQVKSLLVLSCNSQEQMLKASVHAYGAARIQGCILTKLDETASMGEALGVVAQNQLPVVYTTDGQDIPKNIDIARPHQLVAKAVALLKSNSATAVS